jgi:ribosome biogenesis GTPase
MVETHPARESTHVRGIVRALLPRKNAITRKAVDTCGAQAIAANLDAVWVVCGLDRSQGLRSLRRYQALTRIDGIQVSVVLNKLDLVEDPASALANAKIQAPHLSVYALSAQSSTDVAKLAASLVPGTTTALLGPSGVGKSTLVNALLPHATQDTKSVRAHDCRGRHTTSAARLIQTSNGAMLIDTPGLRELGLWQAESSVNESFTDIVELSLACRFRDCKHDREPGCAVRSAIERGELQPERFVSYLELSQECRNPQRKRVRR